MEKINICGQEVIKVSPAEWEQMKDSLKMEYDKVQGNIHIANWGCVFLESQYNTPIDDEFIYNEFNEIANK